MPKLDFAPLRHLLGRLLVAAAAAGAAAWAGQHWWGLRCGHATIPLQAGQVLVPLALAGFVYWAAARLLAVPQAAELQNLIRGRLCALVAPRRPQP
jgi:peptidoglycan biosynthesis protein MviN/MurJ (putative lipid II flippase)